MAGSSSVSGGPAALDESFDAATLHLLRERVAGCAAAAGIPASRTADITLAVHELAANTVRHGPGAGRLLAHAADGTFSCRVSDTGPGPEHWLVRQGHGLWIVREIADKFDILSGPTGFAVTAVFTSPAAAKPEEIQQDQPQSVPPSRSGTRKRQAE